MSKKRIGLAWLFAALIALFCVPGAAFAAQGDIAVHVQYGGTPTYQDAESTVGTVTSADMAAIADKHTGSYGYALNAKSALSSVAVTKYVTLDELLAAVKDAKFEEGDTLYFGTSDGEIYQKVSYKHSDLSAKRYFYPALTATTCAADDAVEVPAVFALAYGTEAITTSAAAALADAEKAATPTGEPRFFIGMTEAKIDAVTTGSSTPSDIDSIYIVKPVDFKVCEVANGQKRVVKGYAKSDLEKLATTAADGKGWLFYESGWQVGVSTKYIPIEALLSNAYGTDYKLAQNQRAVAIADDGFNTTLTYSQINDSKYFYPATGADSQSAEGPEEVGTVLALNWTTTAVSDTAGATVKAVAADPSKLADQLRIFTGLNEADYTSKTAAGNRFATGPVELDVVTPTDMSAAEIEGLAESYAYQGSDFIPSFKVMLGGKELSVQTSKKNFGEDCVASVEWDTAAMTGTLTVKGQNNYTGTITKTLKLAKTVDKPAPLIGMIYNGSVLTGVPAGEGYTLSGNTATDAGSYIATATLKENYIWSDGTSEPAKIDWSIMPVRIDDAKVALAKASAAYTGASQKGTVSAVMLGDSRIAADGYDVSAAAGTNVGTYKVTVTGKGNFAGTASADFKITAAANKAVAKSKSVKKTFTAKKLKKKAQTVALPAVATTFGKATWKVTTADKKKVLSLKGGKIVVKKGAKVGTYTIKLKASVAKTKNYAAASIKKPVTVKVVVK